MKKNLPKILFYYSALVALLITISSGTFVFLFLPVLAYFLLKVTRLVAGGVGEKLLTYYGFIVSSLMVLTGFIAIDSPTDLVTSILFSPILIFFTIHVLPKRKRAINLPSLKAVVIENEEPGEVTKLKKEGVDIDRRAFLKLIGTAGLSLFLFSMFTKKAEAAFFGSVPGPGTVSLKDSTGTKIDPAEKHPTDGYNITEIDDAGTDAYTGFIKKGGSWYIIKEIGSGSDSSYRYTKGSSDFSTNWTNRVSLTYDYYNNVF